MGCNQSKGPSARGSLEVDKLSELLILKKCSDYCCLSYETSNDVFDLNTKLLESNCPEAEELKIIDHAGI